MEELSTQLQHQLACVTQNKTISQLESLVAVASDNSDALSQLQKQVKTLRGSLEVNFLSQGALNRLRAAVDCSDGLVLKYRKNIITTALQGSETNSRFSVVTDAHKETYAWIFDPSDETSQNTKNGPPNAEEGDAEYGEDAMCRLRTEEQQQRPGRQQAAAQFVQCLKAGSGFFSIFGKPGAGKSTLMKFLQECPNTRLSSSLG
ncbi:hypothetical protein B0T16DRAFT_496148 [Cercophora newfieldiana]|uniref:Uncharacterized protein n=1 Tax=Cercophora newfieldiana TaxID=92897 RepID=A0AA39XWA0_9PEZI|nr:hypothetical protein B0T16DRAFT_496148 [Cercophora newfieldiana]